MENMDELEFIRDHGTCNGAEISETQIINTISRFKF